MRTISVNAKLSISREDFWGIMTNIRNYPKYFKYISDVYFPSGQLEVGKEWVDTTTILWVPLKIRHKITRLEKEKEVVFEIPLIFGGHIIEKLVIEGDSKNIKINGQVNIDLKNKAADLLIGPLLEYRFKNMINSAIENIEKKQI